MCHPTQKKLFRKPPTPLIFPPPPGHVERAIVGQSPGVKIALQQDGQQALYLGTVFNFSFVTSHF